MKKLIMAVIVFLVITIQAYTAEPVSLKWDASTGIISGYIVEWVLTSNISEEWNTKDVGDVLTVNNIAVVFGLNYNNDYTFRVKAYNAAGSSGPSNTVTYTNPAWEIPPDTVVEENINIPGIPNTLILNFNVTQ